MRSHDAPALIIVSGPPASGKTTIGRRLAAELRLPFFDKDSLKELLADDMHVTGLTWSKTLGGASFDLLYVIAERQLAAGCSVLLEGNFSGAQPTSRFQSIIEQSGACTIQVNVRADGDLLIERYREREESGERHPIHVDRPRSQIDSFRSGLMRGELPPLDLGGDVITVDTTDFDTVDIPRIAKQIRQRLNWPDRLVVSGVDE